MGTAGRPEAPLSRLGRDVVLERRHFLRQLGWLGAGAATVAVGGGLLAGCADGSARSAAADPGPVPAPPFTFDPAHPWWTQGGFAPVAREVTATDLAVTGSIPAELSGLYVRNGANPANGTSGDWFLGDGMLHGVRLQGGRAAWYRNRWVTTPLLQRGTTVLSAPAQGLIPGEAVNPSNTSVVWHAGKLLSLCEVGWPFRISTADLSTVGADSMGGRLPSAMTAHPKIDPATGEMHAFGYGFEPPYLTYFVVAPDGTLTHKEEIPVPGPTMIHDFAITDRDVVFWDLPVVFDLQLAASGRMPFVWKPSAGARVGVMPLGGPASSMRWVEIDPCYVFHGTNAFRDGGSVHVDVGHLPSFYRAGGDPPSSLTVRRWTIDTSGADLRFSDRVLTDRQIDLPTIDKRHTGRPYRYGFYVEAASQPGGSLDWGGIVRRDTRTGNEVTWRPGGAKVAGEGLFVPGGPGEGEGWVLTFVYDWSTGKSELAVLDATAIGKGPVATVALPQRVPFGFHGTWVPEPV